MMWFDRFVPDPTLPAMWSSWKDDFPAGTVGSVLPTEFESYVRIMHPAEGGREDVPDFRWGQIARVEGTIAHPAMQWHKITKNSRLYDSWRELAEPRRGKFRRDHYYQLLNVLAESSWTDNIIVGYWEGFDDFRDDVPEPFCDPQLRTAIARIGRLNYLLFHGPFQDLRTGADPGTPEEEWPETPNMTCACTNTWCVFSEVDFDSTLVGCDRATAQAILADKLLETYEVTPDTNLSSVGDELNP